MSPCFSSDQLDSLSLSRTLDEGGLRPRRRFAEVLGDEALIDRLRMPLDILSTAAPGRDSRAFRRYPHSKATGLASKYAWRTSGDWCRRLGQDGRRSAKAVNAAADGKRVFLTCFNITMANYLRDAVTSLARQRGPHVHRNIEVNHFQGAFGFDGTADRHTNESDIDVSCL